VSGAALAYGGGAAAGDRLGAVVVEPPHAAALMRSTLALRMAES
jgi:hypothetical protein